MRNPERETPPGKEENKNPRTIKDRTLTLDEGSNSMKTFIMKWKLNKKAKERKKARSTTKKEPKRATVCSYFYLI